MFFLTLPLLVTAMTADTVTLEERIDLFDPTTNAFLGSERTWFGPDGRRLRLENTDGEGETTLLFIVRHDDRGRESEAIYFESAPDPVREVFTYSADGRLRTTTYYYEPGVAADRTEIELDGLGREVRKRYFRADGSQYGEEDVLWDDDRNKLGWDFRYVGREGGASFRYNYEQFDQDGAWVRRIRSRNAVPERVEVRTRVSGTSTVAFAAPTVFSPGRVSTDRSETSPSFSRDGKTMVFARYDAAWENKDPFIAYLEDDGWRVESIGEIGSVYNLAISPDGMAVVYTDRARRLHRIHKAGDGWSMPEDLSALYGLTGSYPCLTDDGDLFFYDAEGRDGEGIYVARRREDGFAAAVPIFVPESGTAFDAYVADARGPMLVSRCFDDECRSGPTNGIWEVQLTETGATEARKLPNLPYAWGVQPVEPLGLLVFTDGEDILAVPLSVAGIGR